MRELQPDLVGLSVMTFQRSTARRIISLVKSINPDARVAVGGYDPSLAPEAWTHPGARRGLHRPRRRRPHVSRVGARARRQAAARRRRRACGFAPPTACSGICREPVTTLERGEIKPPSRDGRVLSGYTFMGRPIDVIETSRGCTFDCSFCSIIEMRGRNFHRSADRARDRRHPRRPRPRRPGDLHRRRQHHDRRAALRGAVPRHRRRRPRRHPLPRAGDDGRRSRSTARRWRR